jgi:hypothetical protein
MKHSLTVVLTTARANPRLRWFHDSLELERVRVLPARKGLDWPLVRGFVVDSDYSRPVSQWSSPYIGDTHFTPKPCIWSGYSRITQQDWWSKSNSLNTAIIGCETEWIAFLDDRSVILPGWLDGVAEAMEGGYAVCGGYEKRTGMRVREGVIEHGGIITATDVRIQHMESNGLANPLPHSGEWCFGCNLALPLEWCLEVNGFDETCDGISGEDTMFGLMLHNNGFPIRFDKRMMMIEDRTPDEIGPVMRRQDKGVSPNDKSHALLARLKGLKRALNEPCGWDLRKVRADVRRNKPFPEPPQVEYRDWYDGQLIKEFR